ncbi:hypothetical protein NHF46_14460 [Arthrobacter alpinus]|nr:hypothetical protein [Arthrobacter alpinus]
MHGRPDSTPLTGELLGVLDVSGPLTTLTPDSLRMVRCAVRAAEEILGRTAAGRGPTAAAGAGWAPKVTGPASAMNLWEQ